jgi:hypothetical protein
MRKSGTHRKLPPRSPCCCSRRSRTISLRLERLAALRDGLLIEEAGSQHHRLLHRLALRATVAGACAPSGVRLYATIPRPEHLGQGPPQARAHDPARAPAPSARRFRYRRAFCPASPVRAQELSGNAPNDKSGRYYSAASQARIGPSAARAVRGSCFQPPGAVGRASNCQELLRYLPVQPA